MAKASSTFAFDSLRYLHLRFSNMALDRVLFPLECLHNSFKYLPNSLKVLDYGAGPVIMSTISAAGHASKIVLSDYSDTNRDELRKWLKNDPVAFDWSPYFDHVVITLEGNDENEARAREVRMRERVKDVAFCDINADPPLETTCPGPYDVVIDSGCLTASCLTHEAFLRGFEKISKLLKPGGTLMSYASERKMEECTGMYYIGNESHKVLNTSAEYTMNILKKQGFTDINVKICVNSDKSRHDYDVHLLGYRFISARYV